MINLRRAALGGASAFVLLFATAACGDDGGNNVLTLEEGQCFQDPEDLTAEEIANVEIVDCDEGHDNEIFHVEELEGDDDDFPGADEMQEEAAVCDEEAEDFLGGDAAAAGLSVTYLVPTEESWGAGDRAIVCIVYSSDLEELDESVEGAAEGLETTDTTAGDGETTTTGDEEQDFSELIDECEGGDMAACDELYFATPVGSEEERIGSTCGGRSDEELFGSCEERFG